MLIITGTSRDKSSVSQVLIGFSTHFAEAFVAAEFILIIQSVCLSYSKTLYAFVVRESRFVVALCYLEWLNLIYVFYVLRFLACDISVSCFSESCWQL